MEFPNLGEHCAIVSCKQLDFLPFKCDACEQIYCKQHYFYTSHDCKEAESKNKQVPICPLCNEPVPCKRNESVDLAVSQHIDEECSDQRARKRKTDSIYKNKCSLRGCKQKEVIALICDSCKRNYCLKHRHASDHQCDTQTVNRVNAASKNAASAALERMLNSKKKPLIDDRKNAAAKLQGSLSEEEAFQKALKMSLSDSSACEVGDRNRLQEEEDRMLAKAIEESEKTYNGNKGKCRVS